MPKRLHLQYKLALAIALVLLTTRIGLGSLYTGNLSIFASASDITVSSVSEAVNQERIQRNIAPLSYNSKLARAADSKSRDMITRKYFAHIDPEGHYIWDKIVSNGYTPYTMLGENLAVDFSDVGGLVSAWIDSPTHRANLLNTGFKEQGMGVAFGDTNNGEFSVAVTNTFGTQPTPYTSPEPTKATLQKRPLAKATAPAPSITLTINNSEEISHKDSVTIIGKTIPNISFQLRDSNSPTSAVTIVSDASGNFVYTFNSLGNGQHNFIASTGNISSNNYKVKVLYNPPEINLNTLSITPEIINNQLILGIKADVSGAPLFVTATFLDKNTALTQSGGQYTGNLILEKYTNYQSSSLVLGATDQYGNKDNLTIPLKDYELTKNQNPKNFGSLPQKAASPDLYNTFKYIVIFAGGLFLLFLFGEAFHLNKDKPAADFTVGSNIIVLLVALSTLLLISWWH
ncbi:MAG: hypothetical protein NVSMB66_1380 [Candidatus Doudnabacteria bacterium]